MTKGEEKELQRVRAMFDGLDARIKELEAENVGLRRVIGAQARSIKRMRPDVERIDRLDAIRDHGKPGEWSTVLLALRNVDDGRPLRAAIDAAATVRYVLHPGHVTSKNDGDRHYINANDLMRLYRVPHDSRTFIDYGDERSAQLFKPHPGDVHLHPRHDGNYTMPREGEST